MFGLSEKAAAVMELAIGAVIIVAVGLLIIKVVIGLSRKALTKTTLDESIYADRKSVV